MKVYISLHLSHHHVIDIFYCICVKIKDNINVLAEITKLINSLIRESSIISIHLHFGI